MSSIVHRLPHAGLAVVLILASLPAAGQSRTWGQLTSHTGPEPYDWEIARWIDRYFEDGSPGNGVVSSNILYIETQCYEQAADNVNATTGEAVGDAATDTVSFTNTTYLGAQAPGVQRCRACSFQVFWRTSKLQARHQ